MRIDQNSCTQSSDHSLFVSAYVMNLVIVRLRGAFGGRTQRTYSWWLFMEHKGYASVCWCTITMYNT